MLKEIHRGIIVALFGFAGIVLAGIFYALHERGVGADALVAMGITIAEVMTITIILSLLIGGVFAVVKN